jgi:hypothetical protein
MSSGGGRERQRKEALAPSVRRALLQALDSETAGLPSPDWQAIADRAGFARARSRRRLRHSFEAVAAVVVAGIGIGAGIAAYQGHRTRAELAAGVSEFVDGLFATQLVEGAEYAAADELQGFSDDAWLEGPLLDLP